MTTPSKQEKGQYRILFDYGSYEGLKLQKESFATVDNAVKHALSLNYSTPFLIITIIDWKAND